MTVLVWDEPGSRVFESGLDRGVIYRSDGSVYPWNGLTSVTEKFDQSLSPTYFDGKKTSDGVIYGDFSAVMKAITFPDVFFELEGFGRARDGMYLGDQAPEPFNMSYRNLVADDLDPDSGAYKIHIIYNVTAIPQDQTYSSLEDVPSFVEFAWDLSAVPEEVAGFRPTAHIVIDSRGFDEVLLQQLEYLLYGSSLHDASLPSLADLVTFLKSWYSIEFFDNGDGTWRAVVQHDDLVTMSGGGTEFEIREVDGAYLDAETWQASSTIDTA